MCGSVSNVPGSWCRKLAAYLWNDILLFLYSSICGFITEITSSPPRPKIQDLEKRSDQVVIITGGPRGIALGLIKRLVQLDYTIVMGVRDIDRAQEQLSKFGKKNPTLNFTRLTFYKFELMSLNTVRDFAAQIISTCERVDLLLCNAAIMRAPYELTEDGFESQFQANYLSNFLLTHLLLQKLSSTSVNFRKPTHVIFTSSFFYKQGTLLENELEKPLVYSPYKFYYASKLYGVMNTLHMQQLLEKQGRNVKVFAVHPGNIPTDLWYSGMGVCVGWMANKMKCLFRSVDNGADTILWPVLCSKFINRGGLYLESGRSVTITRNARNAEKQAALYEKSLELVGLKV